MYDALYRPAFELVLNSLCEDEDWYHVSREQMEKSINDALYYSWLDGIVSAGFWANRALNHLALVP